MRVNSPRFIVLVLAAAMASCDRPPTAPPLGVLIDATASGAATHGDTAVITGVVRNATAPTVSYSVNGGSFLPATMGPDNPVAFEIRVPALEVNTATVTVRASEGSRTGEVSHTFTVTPITVSLDPPAAGAVLYGRVAAFAGIVSKATAVVRYSVNGGPERAVQQYPANSGSGSGAGTFRGEAHPLANGANTVVIRAYVGEIIAATQRFDVTVDVPERRYALTVVAEVPSGTTVERGPFLANDGRLAWHYSSADASTWQGGTLVPLTGMRMVFGLNNVGQVLGVEAGGSTSVLWKDGVYSRLTEFPDASMLNDHGHLGRSIMPGYWHDGHFTSYPQPGMIVAMTAMNNHGAMVGNVPPTNSVAAWLAPPQFQHVPGPPLSIRTWAGTIGDGGHVLLHGRTSSIVPEFAGRRDAIFHAGSLTDLSATVGFATAAANVNAGGVVAGTYVRGATTVPFTWKDGRTTDVVLDSAGWSIQAVTDINDAGQIAARGRHEASGQTAILLLTPVD